MCPFSTAVNGPINANTCQHSSFSNIKEQRIIREGKLYVKLKDSCLILRQRQILYVSYHVVAHIGRITRSRQVLPCFLRCTLNYSNTRRRKVTLAETNIAATIKCVQKLLAGSIIKDTI